MSHTFSIVLGTCKIVRDPKEPGHWWFLDIMGWHDCCRREDQEINASLAATAG